MAIARGITGSGVDIYDVVLYVEGAPTAGELVLRFVAARPLTLPPNLSQSFGSARIAAAAPAEFAVALNGVQLGVITFAAGETTATLPLQAAAQLLPGDVLTVTAPASPDATLADVSLTLALVR